jgi:hypothetical protein
VAGRRKAAEVDTTPPAPPWEEDVAAADDGPAIALEPLPETVLE